METMVESIVDASGQQGALGLALIASWISEEINIMSLLSNS